MFKPGETREGHSLSPEQRERSRHSRHYQGIGVPPLVSVCEVPATIVNVGPCGLAGYRRPFFDTHNVARYSGWHASIETGLVIEQPHRSLENQTSSGLSTRAW